MPYDQYGNLVDEYGNPIADPSVQPYVDSGFQPLPDIGVNIGPITEGAGAYGGVADPGSYAPYIPPPAAPPPSTLDLILGHATASKDELKAIIDAWVAENEPKLEGAAAEADKAQAEALGELRDVYGSASPIDYHDPVAALTSEAAKAKADPAARQAQFDALGKLRGWTDPQVTAVEKFLQAQAREAQERDERAHRGAVLKNMAARGVRSGGAEMAALLGGQQ